MINESRAPKQAYRSLETLRARTDALLSYLAEYVQLKYQETVATWEEKPEFIIQGPRTEGRNRVIRVGLLQDSPRAQIYGYLDRGTKSKGLITSSRIKTGAKLFPIQKRHSKTTPGSLTSGPGGIAEPVVFRPQFMHKGIKPRRFTNQIVKMVRAPGGPLAEALKEFGERIGARRIYRQR